MAWMYIVRCSDETFYTGSTAIDPASRVWQHNHDDDRAARYTRKRRPVTLAYFEEFSRVDEAFAREKQVQGWSRAKKLALIEERGADLPELARTRSSDASTNSATGAGFANHDSPGA